MKFLLKNVIIFNNLILYNRFSTNRLLLFIKYTLIKIIAILLRQFFLPWIIVIDIDVQEMIFYKTYYKINCRQLIVAGHLLVCVLCVY